MVIGLSISAVFESWRASSDPKGQTVKPVIESPQTHYAEIGEDTFLAYQVVGEGPPDLVFVAGGGSHVELAWEIPAVAHVFERFASFARLIRFDAQGQGLSDPLTIDRNPTLEDQAKGMLTVLDTVGSEKAAVLANGVGGLLAIFFAATYPNRTASLILDGCYARLARAPDYPWGVPNDVLDKAVGQLRGEAAKSAGASLTYMAPKAMKDDPEFVAHWERYVRSHGGPGASRARAASLVTADVRQVLPAIQAPTLIMYRIGDRWVGRPHAIYLSEQIHGAKLVELPGDDNLMFVGDSDAAVDEIEEFLTGVRPAVESNRVLATVLFTDIVGSTEKAAQVGDRKWREVLQSHDRMVRRQLQRFKGREINTAGDGFFATFDGPGRAIQCACAVRDAVGALEIDVRAGLHTGEIELVGDDAAGMAVHIGARVAALANAGEVLVSGAVPPLVAGSGIEFDYRGEHELKGVPGFWKLFSVRG